MHVVLEWLWYSTCMCVVVIREGRKGKRKEKLREREKETERREGGRTKGRIGREKKRK